LRPSPLLIVSLPMPPEMRSAPLHAAQITVARAAIDQVAAFAVLNVVVARIAIEPVIACTADDGIVAVAPRSRSLPPPGPPS